MIIRKIHFLESTQSRYFLSCDKYNGREKKLIFNIENFLFIKKYIDIIYNKNKI